MRALILSVVLAAGITSSAGADTASVGGKWQLSMHISGTDHDQTCSFTQKEAALTGTCEGDGRSLPLTGKVEEKNVSFTYNSEYNGSPLTVIFKGTLESDSKMSGTLSIEQMGITGDFTATQSK